MEKYSLVGIDGNAYAVMGYVKRAMIQEGASKEDIQSYLDDAMSSDYSHLIAVSADMVDKLNEGSK